MSRTPEKQASRVEVALSSPEQKARWTNAAKERQMKLSRFIVLSVESAVEGNTRPNSDWEEHESRITELEQDLRRAKDDLGAMQRANQRLMDENRLLRASEAAATLPSSAGLDADLVEHVERTLRLMGSATVGEVVKAFPDRANRAGLTSDMITVFEALVERGQVEQLRGGVFQWAP